MTKSKGITLGIYHHKETKSLWERLRDAALPADKVIIIIILYTAVCAIIGVGDDLGLKGKLLAYCIVLLFVVAACFFGAHELWEEDKDGNKH